MTYKTIKPHYLFLLHYSSAALTPDLTTNWTKSGSILTRLYFGEQIGDIKVEFNQVYLHRRDAHYHLQRMISEDYPEGGAKFVYARNKNTEEELDPEFCETYLKEVATQFITQPTLGEVYAVGNIELHPVYGETVTKKAEDMLRTSCLTH